MRNEDDDRVYVANGEQGVVLEVHPKYSVVKLSNPDRIVRVPRSEDSAGDSGCSMELGYAISTHKSQGSEWPIVVLMIDGYPGAVRLCTRKWIYTGLSRAKQLLVGIGRLGIAQSMCQRSGLWRRKTFLREQIDELRMVGIGKAWDQDLLEASNA